MRSVKTTGGFTRGRGMGETQRTSWLLSMPACAEMNAAMQDFTQINYETSKQHKKMSTARLKRDEKTAKQSFSTCKIVTLLQMIHHYETFQQELLLKRP